MICERKTEGGNGAGSPRGHSPQGRRFGLILFCGLAASLALGGWLHFEKHLEVLSAQARMRATAPTVRTGEVQASGGEITLNLPGTTSAFEAATIFARASGYIEKRNVDIGSKVQRGNVLAVIAAPELDHQIAQAKANLAQTRAALRQAQANRDLAKVTFERDDKLVVQGYLSIQQGDVDRQTLIARESDVQTAEANIQAQQEQVRVLEQQKDYQKVTAPFSGVVTQRNIDVGSLVQADAASGTSLFSLARGDVIRVQLYVPQDASIGVTPGIAALVRVPEMPGRTFPGQVSRIADALQQSTRTLLAEIDVPNPDAALTPGMYCSAELRIPRRTPSFMVPGEAVIFNKDGLQVAVVEDGAVRIRKIAVVRDFGTQVEASQGVKAGDKVVLNPAVDLAEGEKVQVIE